MSSVLEQANRFPKIYHDNFNEILKAFRFYDNFRRILECFRIFPKHLIIIIIIIIIIIMIIIMIIIIIVIIIIIIMIIDLYSACSFKFRGALH